MGALAALLAVGVLLAGVSSASAAVATQQFQSVYAGDNPWVSWEWWVPQPQCTEAQPIYGSEPAANGKYPVFIYVHSTYADLSGNVEGQMIAQLAAAQGFVAIAPSYDSLLAETPSNLDGRATCMFSSSRSTNVISYACSLPEADCSNGVVVAGFSQGGAIAILAKNYNQQVQAAWALGVNQPDSPAEVAAPAGTRALPNDKLRVNVGQLDVTGAGSPPLDLSGPEALTGLNCGADYQCLQPDGSGYYVVANSEVADKSADHCYWVSINYWFYGCEAKPTVVGLDPGFAPPSTTPWSLIANLNWLRAQL